MLETPTQRQQQLWIAQRLYRICATLRNSAKTEPCLEQYENQVQLMLDETVTPATSAWLQIIAQCLRTGSPFQPKDYIR